jgi:hypothetical protein
MRIWRQFWTSLGTNSNAQRLAALVAVFQAVVVLIGLIFAGFTLHYNAKTLDESNRIAWRTFLDNKSSDLGREILNHDVLHCVYKYKLPTVDDDCQSIIYDKRNLPLVLEYVLQELWHLDEIKEYSDKEDKDYYNDWYAAAARDFSDDPTGVVSFVFWTYLGCDHQEAPPAFNDQEQNCNFARRLGICMTNDQYSREPQHCFDNLAAKRAKFLKEVENHRRVGQFYE